jgi:hypothetical protein
VSGAWLRLNDLRQNLQLVVPSLCQLHRVMSHARIVEGFAPLPDLDTQGAIYLAKGPVPKGRTDPSSFHRLVVWLKR